MLFNPANWPYWLFLSFGILLFLVVIASGGADDDLDIDAEMDADVDGDFGSLEILGWLGIGQAPLSLLLATDLSLWGVLGWMFNVWLASFLGRIPSQFFGFGGIVFIVSLILSLFLGSLIARPIGKLFASFGEDASGERLIGCVGTVSSAFIPVQNQSKIGQVDVTDAARNLVTINATLPEWSTVIPYRGQAVLVIERHPHYYLVIAKDSVDEDHWMANASRHKR